MDENFDQLRKLLGLKRYEAPPPGFFENFSTKVAARIASAEAVQVSWWQKLGLDFSFKPAAVCALGVVICGLLSAGVLTAVVETADQPVNTLAMPLNPAVEVVPFGQLIASDTTPSSTDPVFAATRFDQFSVRAQPVLFRFNK
jgi:hypothetical protein